MLTTKQLSNKIGSIKKSRDAYVRNVHEALCSAAGYAYEFDNADFFTKLIDAVMVSHKSAVRKWINANGFVRWDSEKEVYKINRAAIDAADFADGFAVSMYLFTEVERWDHKPETSSSDEGKEFDVDAWAARTSKKHSPAELQAMIAALIKMNPVVQAA